MSIVLKKDQRSGKLSKGNSEQYSHQIKITPLIIKERSESGTVRTDQRDP